MIFGTVEIPDVPIELDMHAATTRDDVRVEEAVDPESEAETDEEIFEVVQEASYEGLTETDEAMVDAVVQASLVDTSMPTTVDVTPGTEAQDQSDVSDTDARQMERLFRHDFSLPPSLSYFC
uniref:Polyprotein protein n=1 Tax=Solanum tuberosum TaxID=4113 RepID=M1DPE7_SOLTU